MFHTFHFYRRCRPYHFLYAIPLKELVDHPSSVGKLLSSTSLKPSSTIAANYVNCSFEGINFVCKTSRIVLGRNQRHRLIKHDIIFLLVMAFRDKGLIRSLTQSFYKSTGTSSTESICLHCSCSLSLELFPHYTQTALWYSFRGGFDIGILDSSPQSSSQFHTI